MWGLLTTTYSKVYISLRRLSSFYSDIAVLTEVLEPAPRKNLVFGLEECQSRSLAAGNKIPSPQAGQELFPREYRPITHGQIRLEHAI